jgi:hypothetical protein
VTVAKAARVNFLDSDFNGHLRLQLQLRDDIADLVHQIAKHSGEDAANVAKRLIGIGARQEWSCIQEGVT